jgi:hypothetical protein
MKMLSPVAARRLPHPRDLRRRINPQAPRRAKPLLHKAVGTVARAAVHPASVGADRRMDQPEREADGAYSSSSG